MLLFYFLLVLHAVLAHGHHRRENKVFYKEDDAQFHFENFMKTHNKIYDSELEKAMKFNTFKENLLKINEMNRKDPYSTSAINKFADLSSEEFVMKYTGLRLNTDSDPYGADACRSVNDTDLHSKKVPDTFDWRDNITIKVKNQLACGSCWAFAATGNVEAQYLIKYNKSLSLSEQQIVDCDENYYACGGGLPSRALRYLIQVGGQESERDYPYFAQKNMCKFSPKFAKVKVNDCINFRVTSEKMIQRALIIYGPLIAAIDGESVKLYESGVMTNCVYKRINHAVLIVGYGTENGKDFWIIKNSWGSEWGDDGYFRIERDINSCGILNPSIATSVIA